MTASDERTAPSGRAERPSRRAVNAERRQSRRPSRLGTPAGAAPGPDYRLGDDAGFPGLLARVWRRAAGAPDLAAAVGTLLTLDGHVSADVQLRALSTAEEAALRALTGLSWREPPREPSPESPREGERPGDAGDPAFTGEIGLSRAGRVLVRVPSQAPLAAADLVDGVIRVPWSARQLREYTRAAREADRRLAASVADCRRWLADAGAEQRDALLRQLTQAALHTAPFVLYHQAKQYTNFRDRNTLSGKTLWPGHPDCALSALLGIPLELWSDDDVTMVVCLALLIRSAGFARIEEANGTQLTVDHVAYLLEETRRRYNEVPGTAPVPPAGEASVAALNKLAWALRLRRQEFPGRVQLYREIQGVLMHKTELVAGPPGAAAEGREAALVARLRERLPVDGATLAELGAGIAASPGWLARPRGAFGTGLEALVHETVAATVTAFEADFAMSRGTRSVPALIEALRREDWERIVAWDITSFFCCVVPSPDAGRHFSGSPARLADTAWAMSSRMRYNSWHFLAGNLPKVGAVESRDYFVPPTIPDLSLYSDQHHHGHVAAKVRFSIRSPQPVRVLDRTFNGFVDLRLLRCTGPAFGEQDLLAAHRASAFIARATTLAAGLAAAGADLEVTAFDSRWHWDAIMAAATASASGEPLR